MADRDGPRQVSLIEFNAYRTEHDLVLTVSQTWPVAEVEDFTVSPRSWSFEQPTSVYARAARRTAVATLVAEGVIEDGAQLELEVRALRLSSALREQVASGWPQNRDALAPPGATIRARR